MLYGYFQSWRYAPSGGSLISEKIRTLARPAWSEGYLELIKSGRGSVSLHIRRGDYLQAETHNIHGLAGAEYFERAIRLVRGLGCEGPILVYSDDLGRAIQELDGIDGIVPVKSPADADPLDVLRLMSDGAAVITSNSTFSWWAAYINDVSTRPVVCPTPWFQDPTLDSADIVPPWWFQTGASH
jgi:hypothetical protein